MALISRRRKIRWLFILAGFAFVGVCSLYLYCNLIVRAAIARVGSEMTGTEVVVRKVRADLLRGRLRLYGLRVRNPEGFRIQNAVMADFVRVRVDWRSVFSDELVVREVRVAGPTVVYEAKLGGSNLKRIERAVDRYVGPGDSARVLIKRFRVTGGSVVLGSRLFGRKKGMTLPLPAIDKRDVGRGTASWQGAVRDMTASLGDGAHKAARGSADKASGIADSAKETAQGAYRSLQSILGR